MSNVEEIQREIAATNAFLQHPVGHAVGPDGTLQLASFWAFVLNPWALAQYAHTMMGSVVTAAFVVTAVSSAFDTFFLFAIPSCVVEGRPWLGSLWHSCRTAARSYGLIFLTVLAVTLCYLPVLVVRFGSVGLVEGPWPEAILLLYLVRIFSSWMLGTLLTVWATVYLIQTATALKEARG